jgi:co-chaperonin GroES (HSP10)|uniref:Co-chaperonin GroES n=1 Tax=uncultured virus TaxID=340016 RepID=A0A221S317_9VIRU|nr:co-chaperonin GroES [uncultured virus]
MSEIATLKKDIVTLDGKPISSKKEEAPAEEQKPTQLPEVKGYRILCAVPVVDEKYQSGILKSDKTKNIEEHSTVVLFVIKLGDMAYKDEDRFPTGPWCKEGDFVITRAYSGTRIKIHGKEFRIINDDTVEAVVDDPRGYERA